MNALPPNCSELREAHLVRDESGPAPSGLELHVRDCAACAAWLERHTQLTGVLGSMDRFAAPDALDDDVRTALEVGTARLVESILELPRVPAPAELDARLAESLDASPAFLRCFDDLAPKAAPAVLDRLVDEELRDKAALTRRFTRSLTRASGPRALAERVEEALQAPGRTPAWRRMAAGSLAAAALVVVSLPLFDTVEASPPGVPTGSTILVQRVDSLQDLDPFARGFVLGLTGTHTENGEEEL